MIKAVIFGFNGVIYNSTIYIAKARDIYLEKLGVKRSEAEISETLGRALRDQIKLWNQRYNINLDYETFSRETRKMAKELMIQAKIQPNDGVTILIDNLKKNNIKIGIASFFPKKFLMEDLKMLKLKSNLFDVIIALEDIEKYRPNPEFLLLTSSKLNVNPEECVYISDDNEGLSVAKSIKMKTIGLVNNLQPKKYFKDADLIVNSLEEFNIKRINELK